MLAEGSSPIDADLTVLAGESTLAANAEVISLEQEAARERLSVDDQIKLSNAELRRWVANRVVRGFVQANGVTLAVLVGLVALDDINIGLHLVGPGDRIITNQVIMALLGATTVQLGAIAVIIARYLFPGRSGDS